MIVQKLVQDQNLNSGTLTITAEPGHLAELVGLHEELRLRVNVDTQGTVTTNPKAEVPPGF